MSPGLFKGHQRELHSYQLGAAKGEPVRRSAVHVFKRSRRACISQRVKIRSENLSCVAPTREPLSPEEFLEFMCWLTSLRC